MPLGRLRVLVPLVPLALLVGGCGSAESEAAAEASTRFVAMVRNDPSGACGMLAPHTRQRVEDDGDGDCVKGLEAAGLPAPGAAGDTAGQAVTEVAGHTAQVKLPGQAVFLSLFDDGWRIIAAGCTRPAEDTAISYDCLVQGD